MQARHLLGIFAAAAMVLANRAQATINIVQTDSTNGMAGFAAGTSLGNAADATTNGAGVHNLASFVTADTVASSSDFTSPSLAQSLESMTAGTLSDIKLVVTGNPLGGIINLALYDLGPVSSTTANAAGGAAGNNHPLTNTGANGYLTAAQANDAMPPGTINTTFVGANADAAGKTPSGGNYIDGSNNLLSASSQFLALPGYNTAGANAAIMDFQLSGADAITLKSNEEYVIEVSGLQDPNILTFQRNDQTVTDYPYGQSFKGQNPLPGNTNRDWAMGLTSVPEPASLALIASATLLVFKRNR